MLWFTSDWHFGHNKDFIYAARGYHTMEEMCEGLIRKHNALVAPEDTVYFLGDATVGDNEYGLECMKKLNGHIRMINGNHDSAYKLALYSELDNVDACGTEAEEIDAAGYRLFLCHYPVLTKNICAYEKRLSLHGHTHSTDPLQFGDEKCINVAADAHDGWPVSLTEILEYAKKMYAPAAEMRAV